MHGVFNLSICVEVSVAMGSLSNQDSAGSGIEEIGVESRSE